MKTPLQKLIEKWEEDAGYVRPGKIHTHAPIFQAFIDDAKAMLEEEREVIENAYRSNCSECTRHEITKCDVKRRLANNEVAILNYSTRELHLITIENLNEIIKEYWFDERPVIERVLRDLGYDTWNINFMT